MQKITLENIESLYIPDKDVYRHWAEVNEKIVRFCNISTLKQFNYIFDDDGQRLWQHFKGDCDSIYQKFSTYLTQEQNNILVVSLQVIPDNELYTL